MPENIPPAGQKQLGQAARNAFKSDEVSRAEGDALDKQISPAFQRRHKQALSNADNDKSAAAQASHTTKSSEKEPGFSVPLTYGHQASPFQPNQLQPYRSQLDKESAKFNEPTAQEQPAVHWFRSFLRKIPFFGRFF